MHLTIKNNENKNKNPKNLINNKNSNSHMFAMMFQQNKVLLKNINYRPFYRHSHLLLCSHTKHQQK